MRPSILPIVLSPRDGHPRMRVNVWAHPSRRDEIATRRFSVKFFGFNWKEVRRAQLEISAALDRARTELTRETVMRTALERALENSIGLARRTILELQEQLMAAQATLIRYQALERTLECELLIADTLRLLLPDGEGEREPGE